MSHEEVQYVRAHDGLVLGLGVTIAARVLGEADGGEVLTTRAVVDLWAGAAFEFEDRGAHTLKGVPGEWTLVATHRGHPRR